MRIRNNSLFGHFSRSVPLHFFIIKIRKIHLKIHYSYFIVKIWKPSVSTISEIILAPNQNSLTLDQILAGCSCKVCFYKKLCISNKGKRWFTIDCSWKFVQCFNSFITKSLSYRNQSIGLQKKSINWFLYDRALRHERVKGTWLGTRLYKTRRTNRRRAQKPGEIRRNLSQWKVIKGCVGSIANSSKFFIYML